MTKGVVENYNYVEFNPVDPEDWLIRHENRKKGSVSPEWFEIGMEAMAACNGCLSSSLRSNPDLRVEILLTYLMNHEDAPMELKSRIWHTASILGLT
jgi:hypothetical protein